MSTAMNNGKRVFARANARILTADELKLVSGGDDGDSTSNGTTKGGADSVVVVDDITVPGA
ncbi:hypothetical protein FTW19_19970 [Terriglobus albidus]|uniref:Uncharacterized protein n=1 Tax=Terriglobus albidus TaxID=1592106 RepID=A0A5B9EI46_9BACT|nr:hypothetical protein [Terriglobus albidus]QEE30057.1 hypothetical protein FTW19_19970 [Terriglobus albidus]